ncbi:MAG: hypothetical protein JNL08_09290 [Planctomycetes bacterium]|nr:hypothetical protein [Planctomycetota bacterium]
MIHHWMSWESGVDLVAMTQRGLQAPNVILHVARTVHTPVGSAPAGMVLWQPDPAGAPAIAGFVSTDPRLAAWFGPHVFAGTPFEQAPALAAKIDIRVADDRVGSRIEVGGHVFEVEMSSLSPLQLVHRPAGSPMPFAQQGVEARAAHHTLKIDGRSVAITVPATAMGGSPGACWAPAGLYAR